MSRYIERAANVMWYQVIVGMGSVRAEAKRKAADPPFQQNLTLL